VSADGGDCGPGPLPPFRGPPSGRQPLHRPHRGGQVEDRSHRPGRAIRQRRKQPGPGPEARTVQDLRRDPGHLRRKRPGQVRAAGGPSPPRRPQIGGPGEVGEGVHTPPVRRQGDGPLLLRPLDGGGPGCKEARPRRRLLLLPGDGLRHARRGHREGACPRREERSTTGGRRRRQLPPPGNAEYNVRGEGGEVLRPRDAVHGGQRLDDRLHRPCHAEGGGDDLPRRVAGPTGVPDGRGGGEVEVGYKII